LNPEQIVTHLDDAIVVVDVAVDERVIARGQDADDLRVDYPDVDLDLVRGHVVEPQAPLSLVNT
jgi:hypothetical protein